MHILYIHQYFATPHGKTGTRSYEFARRWVAAGHHVTILTSTAQLTDADLPNRAQAGRVSRFQVSGIDVIGLRVRYRQSMGFTRRLIAFMAFALRATWHALWTKDVDIVYATSTPLTIGLPAIAGKWLRRRRYVFEVRDVWPAIPIEMGIIRNPLAKWFFRRIERMIYRHAEAVVALSPGMTTLVRSVAPSRLPIVTVPNCADTDFFHPEVDGSEVRRTHGWEGRFVCLHTGAMGLANGLDDVLSAAIHFRNDPEFLFVLVGEGREKHRLMEAVVTQGLTNLEILDGVPKQQLPAIIAACDVGLVTFANVPVLEHNSANKFFDYLSAGKPVVLNAGGWMRKLLEANHAGTGCSQGDVQAFCGILARWRSDAALRAKMGNNARRLALDLFDRDKLAARTLDTIERAANRTIRVDDEQRLEFTASQRPDATT